MLVPLVSVWLCDLSSNATVPVLKHLVDSNFQGLSICLNLPSLTLEELFGCQPHLLLIGQTPLAGPELSTVYSDKAAQFFEPLRYKHTKQLLDNRLTDFDMSDG